MLQRFFVTEPADPAPRTARTRPFREDYCRVMGYTVKTLKNATPTLSEFIKVTEHVTKKFIKEEGNLLVPVS